MKQFCLTHKDLLELKYWLTCDWSLEQSKSIEYLKLFGLTRIPFDFSDAPERPRVSILEIGTGPFWGLLPHIPADRKIAIDPLLRAYHALSILEPRNGIQYFDEAFERWDTNDKFDRILCANALDHGEMGFHLMPKFANLLKPKGRLYIHVQLREPDMLNLIHDHCLTIDQLDRNLSYTDLVEVKREILDKDFDAPYCPALVGIWEKS